MKPAHADRGFMSIEAVSRHREREVAMCRWMAYSGDPVLIEDLLFRPEHSIIDQSLHAQLGEYTTNGDGFGVGWYGDSGTPAVFKSTHPAWNNRDLREIAGQIRTPMLFAHVRSSTGTPVQRSNCHPFRYGRWLWMHNGSLAGFPEMKRDLQMAVDPSLFAEIEGSTDSETLFFLALAFGLQDDPPGAVARAVGLVEEVGRRHGIEHPVRMTVAAGDGESIWTFRYSSEKKSDSLYYSTTVEQLWRLYPDLEVLDQLGAETRLIVSEPLRDLPGAWNEVPECSWGVVRPGADEIQPFTPLAPRA
jgi:predicted glutamine amidotransferase